MRRWFSAFLRIFLSLKGSLCCCGARIRLENFLKKLRGGRIMLLKGSLCCCGARIRLENFLKKLRGGRIMLLKGSPR